MFQILAIVALISVIAAAKRIREEVNRRKDAQEKLKEFEKRNPRNENK